MGLKKYFIDCTAMATEANPIFASFEVGLAGMSNETSRHARYLGTGLSFLGLSYVYAKGRDKSKEFFNVNENSSKKVRFWFDIGYGTAFNLAWSPIFYAACGVPDAKQFGWGIFWATVLGAVNGFPIGYSIDSFRDLTSIKECNRKTYPKIIKNRHPHIKKGIAVGLVAASIGAMGLIYNANSYYHNKVNNNVSVSENLEGKVK